MDPQELKTLVESGLYKPDPAQIAEAMLDRRGVRDLLIPAAEPTHFEGSVSFRGSAGRSRAPQAMPPRAA